VSNISNEMLKRGSRPNIGGDLPSYTGVIKGE